MRNKLNFPVVAFRPPRQEYKTSRNLFHIFILPNETINGKKLCEWLVDDFKCTHRYAFTADFSKAILFCCHVNEMTLVLY